MFNSKILHIFAMYKFKKMLLTNEKLQRLFQESLNRQRKRKEREQKKKEREKKKKALLSLKKNKNKGKAKDCIYSSLGNTSSPFNSRDFNVYNNKYIEREIADEVLYTTRHELQEAEKRGEGKINWYIWDKLLQKNQNK